MNEEPQDTVIPAPPDLARDPETARVRARVIAGLFGDDEPGARIGRYAVQGKLGQGAMGVVYEAFDDVLDRRVAIKLVRTDLDSAIVRARLVREGQALARVNHPNVVHVFEVGEDDGRLFVAMELVDGMTLREWSRKRRRAWSDVLTVCIAAGRGLSAVHAQGLTHRDFKPDNVMVGDDGRVRVMDFGLARFAVDEPPPLPSGDDDSELASPIEATATGRVVGTPAYMAPEQRRASAADASADQFSFCVTLWEALHGRRPFEDGALDEPPRTGGRRVPAWIRAALLRGLRREAGSRWPSMAALLDALERGRARARRRVRIFGLAAVACVVGGLGLGHALDRNQRERTCEREGDAIAHEGSDAARAWAAARTEACRRAEVDEIWDDATVARARWCLDDVRTRMDAASDPYACLDPQVLARISVPPADRRDEARAIADALWAQRAAAQADAGELAALTLRADAVGFAPLQAEARTLHAETLARAGSLADAEAIATAAYFLAAHADAWVEANAAALLLRDLVARPSAREALAHAWTRHAEVADELSGRPR
jgi:serine/threonine protein kinase